MKYLVTFLLSIFTICASAHVEHINEIEPNKYIVNELYTTWDTHRVNCYGSIVLPVEYLIDLTDYTMPIEHTHITSKYGYRAAYHRMHNGVDLKLYIGDTVKSCFGGVVRIVNYEAKGYGNYVVIRHPNGLETVYGHLSKALVHINDTLVSGEPIGLGGNTGRSTGSHLHLETRLLGKPINPELIFDFVKNETTGKTFLFRRNCVEVKS